jgi:hypothetical protein
MYDFFPTHLHTVSKLKLLKTVHLAIPSAPVKSKGKDVKTSVQFQHCELQMQFIFFHEAALVAGRSFARIIAASELRISACLLLFDKAVLLSPAALYLQENEV